MVTLIRRIDRNWFDGRIGNRKGIFPVSYVDVICEPGSTRGESIESEKMLDISGSNDFFPSSKVTRETAARPPAHHDPAELLPAARQRAPEAAAAPDGAAALLAAAVELDDDEDDQDDVGVVVLASEGGAHRRRAQRAHAVSFI